MALIDNILAYWALEDTSGATGTVVDAVGNNDGTNAGADNSATGQINNCFQFVEANSDWVSIPSSGDIDVDGSAMTLNCWVFNDTTIGNGSFIGPVSSGGYFFGVNGTSNKLRFGRAGQAAMNSTGTALTDDTWHMVTVTYEGDNAKFYLDGAFLDTVSASHTMDTGIGYTIGVTVAGIELMDGRIDEFGIWGAVLSADDITELYASGAGLGYPFSDAVADNAPFLGANF